MGRVDEDNIDDVMVVIANFTSDELEKFASVQGMTKKQWEEIIANWKAERMN
jgi:hypothetical protein